MLLARRNWRRSIGLGLDISAEAVTLKVNILTYHFTDNYGALLQAYALRRWFMQRGIAAEFLNYHPSYADERGSFERWWDVRKRKKNLVIAYLKLSSLFWQLFQSRTQLSAFGAFWRERCV